VDHSKNYKIQNSTLNDATSVYTSQSSHSRHVGVTESKHF